MLTLPERQSLFAIVVSVGEPVVIYGPRLTRPMIEYSFLTTRGWNGLRPLTQLNVGFANTAAQACSIE